MDDTPPRYQPEARGHKAPAPTVFSQPGAGRQFGHWMRDVGTVDTPSAPPKVPQGDAKAHTWNVRPQAPTSAASSTTKRFIRRD